MVKIKELFASIQGEGPFIGYKQVFIRLCGCNLKCKYCDTDFELKNAKDYSIEELIEFTDENKTCHSVSLTGGEPLLHTDFIKEFAKKCTLPIYLETNGILYKELEQVIDSITYVSADIKLPSVTGMKDYFSEHEQFFAIASQKELFAKAVFDENITEAEIDRMCTLCKKFDIELILQPKMTDKTLCCDSTFMENILQACLNIYPKVRLIPQVHKFINVL